MGARRRTDKAYRGLAAAVLAMGLAACSGGGGDEPGVTYTGVTTQAAVTDTNAMDLTSTAYQGGNSGGAFAFIGVAPQPADGASGATERAIAVTRILEDAVKAARFSSSTSDQVVVGATQTVSGQLDPGNCGGTASFSGSANDVTGDFHATFTFSAWCNDGVTVSGRVGASGHIDVQAEELLDLQFSFALLTVSDGTDTLRASGTITATLGTSESLAITMDYAAGDGTTYRVSNLTLTSESLITGGESLTLSGRVYHPIHGYVDVSTPQPLVVESGQTSPSSGELVVSGAGGSHARLTALSPTQFQLEVDQDGDDFYETDLGNFNWDTV